MSELHFRPSSIFSPKDSHSEILVNELSELSDGILSVISHQWYSTYLLVQGSTSSRWPICLNIYKIYMSLTSS